MTFQIIMIINSNVAHITKPVLTFLTQFTIFTTLSHEFFSQKSSPPHYTYRIFQNTDPNILFQTFPTYRSCYVSLSHSHHCKPLLFHIFPWDPILVWQEHVAQLANVWTDLNNDTVGTFPVAKQPPRNRSSVHVCVGAITCDLWLIPSHQSACLSAQYSKANLHTRWIAENTELPNTLSMYTTFHYIT